MPISSVLAAVIAAVSAVSGACIGAIVNGWWNSRLDQYKRRREERDAVKKYRDPLLLACEELQSQLWHLAHTTDNPKHIQNANKLLFAWIYILQQDVANVHHGIAKEDRDFMDSLYKLRAAFNDPVFSNNHPFHVTRGEQIAIGEKMATQGPGLPLSCIGFAEFISCWEKKENDNPISFKTWFTSLEDSLREFKQTDKSVLTEPTHRSAHFTNRRNNRNNDLDRDAGRNHLVRICKIQRCLISLIEALDPQQLRAPYHLRVPLPSLDWVGDGQGHNDGKDGAEGDGIGAIESDPVKPSHISGSSEDGVKPASDDEQGDSGREGEFVVSSSLEMYVLTWMTVWRASQDKGSG
ncbi:hypothetical protein F5887DRAFT_1078696 [Amanita rubescens]|nr:hypothetical protein F5887DRAFT_1078696 [Amanita rubescens]